jgi:hypothetical protein
MDLQDQRKTRAMSFSLVKSNFMKSAPTKYKVLSGR